MQRKWFWLILLFVWLITLLFESHGGRAEREDVVIGLGQLPIINTLYKFTFLLADVNIIFLIISMCFIAIALVLFLKRRKADIYIDRVWKYIILCFSFNFIFTVLLSAKVSPGYASRPDVMFGVFFYFILLVQTSYTYLARTSKKFQGIIPLILFFIVIVTLQPNGFYRASNYSKLNSGQILELDRFLLQQIVNCDSNNSQIVLHYPKGSGNPLAPTEQLTANRIVFTLFAHHIINKYQTPMVIIDPSVNEKYLDGKEIRP